MVEVSASLAVTTSTIIAHGSQLNQSTKKTPFLRVSELKLVPCPPSAPLTAARCSLLALHTAAGRQFQHRVAQASRHVASRQRHFPFVGLGEIAGGAVQVDRELATPPRRRGAARTRRRSCR